MRFGPTGEFPRGKIDESDTGATNVGIAVDPESNSVIINFGAPTKWIGMPRDTARMFAEAILKAANQLQKDQ